MGNLELERTSYIGFVYRENFKKNIFWGEEIEEKK
jgi:hypothetical protein